MRSGAGLLAEIALLGLRPIVGLRRPQPDGQPSGSLHPGALSAPLPLPSLAVDGQAFHPKPPSVCIKQGNRVSLQHAPASP